LLWFIDSFITINSAIVLSIENSIFNNLNNSIASDANKCSVVIYHNITGSTSVITIVNCSFNNISAGFDGGAMFIREVSKLVINSSSFSSCKALVYLFIFFFFLVVINYYLN
jgi:hypothetical protein